MGFAYFLIEFIIMLCITEKEPVFGKNLNERMWIAKIIVHFVLTLVFIFVGNSFFEVVTEISKYLAGVFVFIMLVTLIDFLYKWG